MAFKYCKSCGSKTQFLGIAPKFCSSCGKPFGEEASSSGRKTMARKAPEAKRAEKLSEDETDVDFIPHIDSLQYDVSPFENKTFKAEDLFNLPNENNGGTSEEKTRKT
jgi:hypothetical protein